MSKVVTAVGKIVAVFDSLADEDKQKVLDAVLTLTGLAVAARQKPAGQAQNLVGPAAESAPYATTPQPYFEVKKPENKIEELAVAARFLEENENLEEISKEDFGRVLKAARRNFDKANFARDVNNAKTRGLFNKGGTGGTVSLSHAGQSYVDRLPDRDTSRLKKRGGAKKAVKGKKK